MKVIFHNKLCPHRVGTTADGDGQSLQYFMPCDGRKCDFYEVRETEHSIMGVCGFRNATKYYAEREDGE